METAFTKLERELDEIEEALEARLPVIELEIKFVHHSRGTLAVVRKLDGSQEPHEHDVKININEGTGARDKVEAYILERVRNKYERGLIDRPWDLEKIPKRAHVEFVIKDPFG